MFKRLLNDRRAESSPATIGGAALLTTGVALAVEGASLSQTNIFAGIVTAAVGLGLVFAGIYATAKGIVTDAVAKSKAY